MRYLAQLFFSVFFSAVLSAQSKDTTTALQEVKSLLQSGTTEKILTNDQWMFLHAKTEFRELIKQFAKGSELTIIAPSENGEKINVEGFVKDDKDNPVADAMVYVYHTDNRGYYAFDTTHVFGNEGDRRHARLFGYLKTDEHGKFVLHTIHPRGYPRSVLPSHIHCEIGSPGYNGIITELRFDEDPRLTATQRAQSQSEHFFIAKKENNIYSYTIILIKKH